MYVVRLEKFMESVKGQLRENHLVYNLELT